MRREFKSLIAIDPQVGLCLALGLAASAEDLWRRRISNWIPVAGVIGGLGWHLSQRGGMGLLTALGGMLGAFLVFLVFYLLGGMGGGDVKLMAAFGALLGPGGLIPLALGAAAIGGVWALAAIGWVEVRRRWLGRAARAEDASIPYAPAITLGAWLALIPAGR